MNIVDSAKSTEYRLLTRYGETEDTISDLDSLQNIAENALNNYQRLTTVAIRIATIQPLADKATLTLLEETVNSVETRMAAWLRSIDEIAIEWRLFNE
ncbi:MAG: hypothetical protein HC820_04180 [Hydrococcus sp. RM1_1_31]|nr:hypothetical protein [Hydrococcus sp. RM1_1_31]